MPSSILIELPDELCVSAAATLEACEEVPIAVGTVCRAEDMTGVAALVVEEGSALLERRPPRSEGYVVVSVAGPGSLLFVPTRSERIRALTHLRLTMLTAEAVRALLETPDVAAVLVARLADQLRESQESLALVGFNHHVDRIRAKLVQLAESHGKVVGDGVRLDLPLTHELLAHMLGSSRGTVTRMLAQLEAEGFLRRERRFLMLNVSPERLA